MDLQDKHLSIAVFGGGCFWCTEAIFERLKGVISVVSGYAGGDMKNPSSEKVSSGDTGHAEVIRIEYNAEQISYEDLLTIFFFTHDPTTLNQQGADIGTQYRSAIFYSNDEQKTKAEKFIKTLEDNKAYEKPIVTELKPLIGFYEAEKYHQKYYDNNKSAPYCQIIIAPKLEKLEKRFSELLKSH